MPGLTVPRGWADAPPSVPGRRTKDIPKELVARAHAAVVALAERNKNSQQILETFKRAFADGANKSREALMMNGKWLFQTGNHLKVHKLDDSDDGDLV